MFALTTFLANAYRNQRRARARQRFQNGNVLLARGDSAKAAGEFREALSYSHSNPQYRLALALALIQAGEPGEAEAHLLQLEDSDATSGVVNLNLARLAAARGDFQDAVTYYHRAIYGHWSSSPERSRIQARFGLIAVLASRKLGKQAVGELLQMAAEAPDDPVLKDRIGNMLLEFGAPSNAADVFREVLNARADAKAYSGLGRANFAAGDYAAAQAAFGRAASLDPRDKEIGRWLALTNRIAALDPAQAMLSARERNRRALQLVDRTLGALLECAGPEKRVPPPPAASLIAEARRLPRRPVEAEIPRLISMAEQLWNARAGFCVSTPRNDEALAFVLAKLARPNP